MLDEEKSNIRAYLALICKAVRVALNRNWTKGGCFSAWFAPPPPLLSHLCGILAINGRTCPYCGYKRTWEDDGDVWQVTGTYRAISSVGVLRENERTEWRGVTQTRYYCIYQQSATEKHNQWQTRILCIVYTVCTTSPCWIRTRHKRTCCDWPEASGVSSLNLCHFCFFKLVQWGHWSAVHCLVWQHVHRQPALFEPRMFE